MLFLFIFWINLELFVGGFLQDKFLGQGDFLFRGFLGFFFGDCIGGDMEFWDGGCIGGEVENEDDDSFLLLKGLFVCFGLRLFIGLGFELFFL